MASWKVIVAVLTAPLWVPLLVAFLCLAVCWGILGQLIEHGTFTGLVITGVLVGLTVRNAADETGPLAADYTYKTITFDAGVIAATLMGVALVLTAVRAKRNANLFWGTPSAILALVYVIVKGALVERGALTTNGVALLVLAGLLPCLQLALTLRLWRHATPEGCAHYERQILERVLDVPFTQSRVAGMHTLSFDSPQRTAGNPLHEGRGAVQLSTQSVDCRPTIVFCHGYMSGTAMYLFNLGAFTPLYRVFSVDWLGCGASERPKFNASNTAETESFFLDALEAWRIAQGIDSFVLVGHSMGGYLCAAYAIRHPQRVRHLVLVSPGGVPTYAAIDPKAATGGIVPNKGVPSAANPPRKIPTLVWSLVSWAWDGGVSPGLLIRGMGPLAPCLVRGSTRARFSRLVLAKPVDAELLRLLGMYFYHNFASDGSGDHALKHIFGPGAKARAPIGERLVAAVQAGTITFPVTFTYGGTHDWMSAAAGQACAEQFRAHGVRSNVHLVSPGGHHLYLESSDVFNDIVLKELALTFQGAGVGVRAGNGSDAPPPGLKIPVQEVDGIGNTPTATARSSSMRGVMNAVEALE